MNANTIGLLTLLIGVPLNLAVVLILREKARQDPGARLLRKDLIAFAVILVHVLVFGVIFVNNDQIPPWLDTAATKIITRLGELALATVPAAIFLWIYLRPRGD